MKQILRTFLWIAIAVLYSLVTSAYSADPGFEQAPFSKLSDPEGKNFSSKAPSNLFCQIGRSESTVTGFNHVPPLPLKVPVSLFFAYSRATERYFFHTFFQYYFYSEYVLTRLESTDVIFPFHYFW